MEKILKTPPQIHVIYHKPKALQTTLTTVKSTPPIQQKGNIIAL